MGLHYPELLTEDISYPTIPFISTLGGLALGERCDTYEAAFGKKWTLPLGHIYTGYEGIIDALKGAQTLNMDMPRNAIAATDLETVARLIRFSKENVSVESGGLYPWVKGKKFSFECKLVSHGNHKFLLAQGKPALILELRGMK